MIELPTSVAGLDTVLGGGLQPGSAVVLAGTPGTGKTILAQQMCFANATPERKAVFYTTLSESHSKLVLHLQEFTFFEEAALGHRVDYVHLGDLLRHAPRDGLGPVVAEVVRTALDEMPALIVIDSIKLLRRLVDETELRIALYDLISRIGHTDTVLLLVGEYTQREIDEGIEFSLVDGIIQLVYEPRVPIDRRWLRVVKLRGREHLEGQHTFHIDTTGVTVYPRTETRRPGVHTPLRGRISSGARGLDELMDGGLPAGEATIVVGPSGVGKSTLATGFLAAGLDQGEGCLYVTFQETPDEITYRAGSFGHDFATHARDGLLRIQHVPVRDLDLDTLTARLGDALRDRPIRRVAIDSLQDLVYAARESERVPAYQRTLVDIVRAAGASLLVTSESTVMGAFARPWEGLMFLFHNVVLMRYLESDSQVGRALNITKMRHSNHEMGLYEFHIGDGGITIGERLQNVTGIVGWHQLRYQPAKRGSPRDEAR